MVLQLVLMHKLIDTTRRRMLAGGKHGQTSLTLAIRTSAPDSVEAAFAVVPQHLRDALDAG
jgi:hypothetical protein